ncbi:hypothetical protein GCM10009549_35450 [Streptomyces thermoalcalitolerans]|uniref:HTH tetR-type domain-containing protein n=1 Tax=Streptomyces thermoalcalitolerans TaxID=65605 RepID=A0ABN1NXA1_9ACTN
MVKQERALRARRSLVRAAAEVFAEKGFAPASLTAVSTRNRATLLSELPWKVREVGAVRPCGHAVT